MAAQVLQLAWPPESPVTMLALEDDEIPEVDVEPFRNVLHERELDVKRAPYGEALEQVVEESRLGYGVVVLALPDDPGEGRGPLTPLASQLLGHLTMPLLLVRKARNLDGKLPGAFTRALVPVAGTRSARAAQELAFAMASELGTDVVLAHIVDRPLQPARLWDRLGRRGGSVDTAEGSVVDRLMAQAVAYAAEFEVEPRTEVRQAQSAGAELVQTAEQAQADLVVVGASARRVDGEDAASGTFLGHTAEQLLDESDATVVVVVSPPTA